MFGLETKHKGFLISLSSMISFIATTFFVSRIILKYGERKIINLYMLVKLATSFIEYLHPSFWYYLILCYIPNTFMGSLYFAAIGNSLSKRIPRKHIGKYYGVSSFTYQIVAVFAPFYGGWIF